MDDDKRIKNILLIILVAILIWYLFRAERKHSFSMRALALGSAQPQPITAISTNSCGGTVTAPSEATFDEPEMISPGSPPLETPIGSFYGAPLPLIGGGAVGTPTPPAAAASSGGGGDGSTQWYAGSGASAGPATFFG